MECKPIYEMLVWDNCKNNCKFCFQRNNPRLFNSQQKQVICDKVITFIDSDQFIKGSHILIVGGEIFDTQADEKLLSDFFDKIVERMLNNTIDILYINTNLIYKNTKCLYNFLELIDYNKLFDRLHFTTSYDFEGRFKSKEDEELMLSNLKELKRLYPDCYTIVNIILTKKACEEILNDKFDYKYFCAYYNCDINFIPYIISNSLYVADKKTIFKALYKIYEKDSEYIKKYIKNLDLPQEKKLYMYKDGKFQFCSCELSDCGHAVNFKKYSNTNSCFICDLIKFFEPILEKE